MQQNQLLQFLQALDAALAKEASPGQRLDLYLIGRSALIARYHLTLATKDVDIVARMGPEELEHKALQLSGEGTPLAARWGMYLQGVPQGLPPIPQGYCQRCQEIPGDWKVLRPKQPEAHDLAVTKLKRFHAGDREDLQIMCDAGDLSAAGLHHALDLAFYFSLDDDEDPSRKRAYGNLDKVIAYLEGKRRPL